MIKKKSLYEKRKLTYEEHKKIDQFLRTFQKDGKEVFELLRHSFDDQSLPVKNMAKAINLMQPLTMCCETKSCIDRPVPMDYDSEEFGKWQMLYNKIGLWICEEWD